MHVFIHYNTIHSQLRFKFRLFFCATLTEVTVSHLDCSDVLRRGGVGEVRQRTLHGPQPLGHLGHEVLQPLLLETEVGQSVFGVVVDFLRVGHFLPQV